MGSFIAPCWLCLKTLYVRNGNCSASTHNSERASIKQAAARAAGE